MSRPKIGRIVTHIPPVRIFRPAGPEAKGIPVQEVHLTIEEAEALRLCDLEGMDQTEAASSMDVSRGTLQRHPYCGTAKDRRRHRQRQDHPYSGRRLYAEPMPDTVQRLRPSGAERVYGGGRDALSQLWSQVLGLRVGPGFLPPPVRPAPPGPKTFRRVIR